MLKISRRGEARIISLDRPQNGNSLSSQLVEELHDALDDFESDCGRMLIITGEGRNFCTGFDLSHLEETTDGELLLRFVRIESLLARLWTARYATVAVGKGRVFGAGADLFAACSYRLACEGATFSFPGAGFGLVLGARRLSDRIGQTAAQDLIASGAVIDSDAATRLGLATARCSEAELQSHLDREIASATRLDAYAFGAVRVALVGDLTKLDSDLAALVRSASRRGLRERIAEFRARSLKAHRVHRSADEAGGEKSG